MAVIQPDQFQVEAIDEPDQNKSDAAGQMLFMALKALSQRAIVAASALFTLLTVASVFWLFLSIKDPNSMQLIEMGMFATFVLAANLIVRRA